jgi:hypothetical protein
VSTFARAGAYAPATRVYQPPPGAVTRGCRAGGWGLRAAGRRPAEVDTAQGWPTIGVPAVLGSRPMAGHVALDHGIGVRIPAPQPIEKHCPTCNSRLSHWLRFVSSASRVVPGSYARGKHQTRTECRTSSLARPKYGPRPAASSSTPPTRPAISHCVGGSTLTCLAVSPTLGQLF